MSNPVPVCTHVKTDGVRCGSPAVSGTELCYHHSTVKAALAKGQPNGKVANGGFAPIPFVFPEDRASMQINFFLLLQAFNEHRIDLRTYNCMLGLLRSMARNLGRMGSLTEGARDQRSAVSDQSEGKTQQAIGNSGHASGGEAVSSADGLESLVDLEASAIAPESCFSKMPKVRDIKRNVFGTSALVAVGQRSLDRCYIPSLGR